MCVQAGIALVGMADSTDAVMAASKERGQLKTCFRAITSVQVMRPLLQHVRTLCLRSEMFATAEQVAAHVHWTPVDRVSVAQARLEMGKMPLGVLRAACQASLQAAEPSPPMPAAPPRRAKAGAGVGKPAAKRGRCRGSSEGEASSSEGGMADDEGGVEARIRYHRKTKRQAERHNKCQNDSSQQDRQGWAGWADFGNQAGLQA